MQRVNVQERKCETKQSERQRAEKKEFPKKLTVDEIDAKKLRRHRFSADSAKPIVQEDPLNCPIPKITIPNKSVITNPSTSYIAQQMEKKHRQQNLCIKQNAQIGHFYGTCIVRGCDGKKKGDDSIKMFKFPKNPDILKIWRNALHVDDDVVVKKNAKICSRHFEPDLIGLRCLQFGAIPTKLLNTTDATCNDNELLMNDDEYSIADNEVDCSLRHATDVQKEHNYDLTITGTEIASSNFEGMKKDKNMHANRSETNTQNNFNNISPVPRFESSDPEELNNDLQNTENLSEREVEELISSCGCKEYFDEKISDLQKDATVYQTLINKLSTEVKELKNKLNVFEETAIIPDKEASEHAINFAKMICAAPNKWYTSEEKVLAANIHCYSSRSYRIMREDLGFRLPHTTSLHRILNETGMEDKSDYLSN